MKKALIVIFIFCSCTGNNEDIDQEINLPEHIEHLENLTVFSPDDQSADSVELVQEVVFESNENVFIEGNIGRFAIDNDDKIYISSRKPGIAKINVFNPDGSFITSYDVAGRGPGEFESIGSIQIRNNKLFVFGPRLQRIGIFSIEDFSLINEQIVNKDLIANDNKLALMLRGRELFVTDSEEFIIELAGRSIREEYDIREFLYHNISMDGSISQNKLLELKDYHFYFPKNGGFPILMPFSRTQLVGISANGEFYTAWSEDFLIKKYDKFGNYERAFYYPIDKTELSIDELNLNRSELRILGNYDIQETWQALRTIEIDDKDRIWVSSLTQRSNTFKWWVLNKEGELLATFTVPGDRSELSAMVKPNVKIHNGYFYELERDISAGVDRIVKYKIVFKDR